jgi:hypothetical protein
MENIRCGWLDEIHSNYLPGCETSEKGGSQYRIPPFETVEVSLSDDLLGGVARPAAASSGYISEPFHGHVKVLLTKRILPYLGPHKIWKISDGNSSK